jgi:C4-dicarboxylate-binding protein DctP
MELRGLLRKKSIFSFIIIACYMFAVMGFISGNAEAKQIVIKAGHVEPVGTPLDKGWRVFKEYVESASGGQIKVDLYPAGQLGGMRELFEGVKLGAYPIAQGDEGAMASFYKPFLIVSIPYLFPNEEVGMRFYRSDFFRNKINKGLIEHTGVRFLAGASYGFRCFTNNKRPIKTPADLKGLKIRVMETPLFVTFVRSMGAGATPISFTELYTALQQGTVDGQENPVGIIADQKFFEVQKYLTIDEHVLGVNSMLINEKFLQGLPENLREIIITGAHLETYVETGGRAYEAHVESLGFLKKKGMQVTNLTPEQKQAFKNASQPPVVKWLKTQIDPALVDEAFQVVKQIEEEIATEAGAIK